MFFVHSDTVFIFLTLNISWCSGRQIIFVLRRFFSNFFVVKELLQLWWSCALFMNFHPEANSGGGPGAREAWGFFCFTCSFCNHFEELQTVLFGVELIINNKPLTYAYPKTIDINCS